jgi:nicotinamide-nucleotide amidase
MFDPALVKAAGDLLEALRQRGWHLATAESCTGGLIAALLTEIPGSSDVVDRGFVTYSNAAKMEVLGVPADVLSAFGAVSEPTARAMAAGARDRARCDIAVAVTGIAGPGGGSVHKPVGLVHLAVSVPGRTLHRELRLGDIGRGRVRMETVGAAVALMLEAIGDVTG